MRLADYVTEFLKKNSVKHIFMLSGGGAMYLVDSVGHSGIEYVCCHHEQAAGIAAQAYSIVKNELGVCLVTTGPGGTNAVTAVGAAYTDSTPVMFISGQVKTADFASLRNVRQFGAQENDIVSMVKPVTKYAVTVMDAADIRYHLEKAVFLALHGRRGPVWLDIPLDIQNAEIAPDSLIGFSPEEQTDVSPDICAEICPDSDAVNSAVETTVKMIENSKRPLFLIGHGLYASHAAEIFKSLNKKLNIPVTATWRALGAMDYSDELFFGSPGLQANRYSNIITQGADLLIVLGSRLDNMITAFNEPHFAYRAKKIIVDIDRAETDKLNMTDITAVTCDVRYFCELLSDKVSEKHFEGLDSWLEFCKAVKAKYPLENEKQPVPSALTDLYRLTRAVSEHSVKDDVIVVSSTSRCNTAGHIAFKHKEGQRSVSSMGFGSMGFALPSVTGAWFASDKSRIIMFEGDGSLQLNIQELETIAHHYINAKMFIFKNAGYAAIATMQDRNFDGFHVGSDENSGVTMPDLKKLSEAYGIPYYSILKNEDIDRSVSLAMEKDGPVICEFTGSIYFDEIPKCISYLDENGNRKSALLENPFPFLSDDEINEIYSKL